MGRKTSQNPQRSPLPTSRFDLYDIPEQEANPALQDFTASVQEIADLVAEIIGDTSGLGVTFATDFVVQLANNKTFGQYLNGQTVPAMGKTAKDVILLAAIEYLTPAITSLTNASLIKTFEVGETLPSGAQPISYAISNATNIKAQPPNVGVPSTNIVGATFTGDPYLLAASGSFNIVMPSGYKFTTPGTKTISLTGTNSNDATFSTTATLQAYYKQFYGAVASAAATSADVRALPFNRFTNAASVFILNTGSTYKTFQLWLPTGQTLSNVTDLDALNANLTSQYVGTSFSVADGNGDLVTGTLYTMSQAVPYSVSHRHQLTIS